MKPIKPLVTFFINWTQPLGRLAYGIAGTVLFFVKYNLDRYIASYYFDRFWTPLHYLSPTYRNGLTHLSPEEKELFTVLLVLSIPFVYVGVMLTVRRLRSAKLSSLLSALFFIPVLNVLFFIMLCVLPEQPDERTGGRKESESADPRFFPSSRSGRMLLSIFLPASVAVPVLLISISVLQHYGWGIFVGIPFTVGCVSVLLNGYRANPGFMESMVVALSSQVMLAVFLVGLAVEGLLCLVILLPLAFVFGFIGGVVGYVVQLRTEAPETSVPSLFVVLLLSIPVVLGFEKHQTPEAPLLKVTSSMTIDAPRKKVWQNVISFSELDPPEDLLFHTGIAYPTRARLDGTGEDAVRYCEFTTGAFVEPIEVWEPPSVLGFSVREQPAPMKELSPYGHIETPHMDGFFESQRGRFELKRLSGGRTKLIGKTWYKHKVWPVVYFRIWSDWIIHRIHVRVLRHIKEEVEQGNVER